MRGESDERTPLLVERHNDAGLSKPRQEEYDSKGGRDIYLAISYTSP